MTSLGGVLRGTAELPIPVRTSTNSCVIDDLIIFTESEYDYAEGDYNYIYTDGIYDDYYEEEVYGELFEDHWKQDEVFSAQTED